MNARLRKSKGHRPRYQSVTRVLSLRPRVSSSLDRPGALMPADRLPSADRRPEEPKPPEETPLLPDLVLFTPRRWLSLSRGCSAHWGGRSSRQLATPQSYHGALLMSARDAVRAARLVSWQKSQMQTVFRESSVYPLIWNQQMLLGKGKKGGGEFLFG